ncbi:MAG: ABC transporter ATP-binding protein [Christensenellales bacterium]
MLEVKNINVFYGRVQALHDVSIELKGNEMVSIIGANGAGKTTLMSTIVGLIHPSSGEINYLDETEPNAAIQKISTIPAHTLVKRGIVYVPEGRRIFSELTVSENLEMGAYSRKVTNTQYNSELEEIFAIFPRLKERFKQRGGTLSGGEQQMLAIARGVMSDPKLLLLDEPSLGLAPVIVDEVFNVIKRLNSVKKMPILLVEQNAFMAMSTTNRTYVLENGHIRQTGPSKELLESESIKRAYLGG